MLLLSYDIEINGKVQLPAGINMSCGEYRAITCNVPPPRAPLFFLLCALT